MSIIMLRTVDAKWKEHLYTMDHLKESVGLRAYGQKDPLQEYQREGYQLFENMYFSIQQQSVTSWFHVEVSNQEEDRTRLRPVAQPMVTNRGDGSNAPRRTLPGGSRAAVAPVKIRPNDPCPCGSGKKYKKCCMKKDAAKV